MEAVSLHDWRVPAAVGAPLGGRGSGVALLQSDGGENTR